jgi:outer membrane protein TolC
MKHPLFIALLALVCIQAAAAADPAGDPPIAPHALDVTAADTLRLGLADAMRHALAVSEEIAAAQAQLERANSLVTQSRAQVLPQLSAGFSYTRQLASVYDTGDVSVPPWAPDSTAALEDRVRYLEENTPTAAVSGLATLFSDLPFAAENNWAASLGLTQKVYQGGSLLGAVRAASHVRAAADAALADAKTDLVVGVMESYLGALLADELVAIAVLGYAQAGEQYELVRLRHEVGKAADFDLLQAEVQRDNQRPLVVEAENARSLAQLNLRRLLNLSPRKPVILADTLLAPSAPVPGLAGIDRDSLAAAAELRPAVRTVEEAVAARVEGVKVARGGYLPEVSLFATYGQQAYPGEFFPGSGDWNDDLAVGLRVNVPIFDGFLTGGKVSEARAQLRTDEQRLAILREERRLAVEQRVGELERARADLLSRQQTVSFARRVHELARLRFEEGAANLFDVSDARISEQVARINEARARYDMLVALARLEKLTGRPYLTSLVGAPAAPPAVAPAAPPGEER